MKVRRSMMQQTEKVRPGNAGNALKFLMDERGKAGRRRLRHQYAYGD